MNTKAPAELERILNKALARDPRSVTSRRASSAVSLNDFLYRYGKPVGSFDIATLVQATVRDKQRMRPMQHSIIDKLIEEALLEFTSLQEDGTSVHDAPLVAPADAGSAPLSLDKFQQSRDWAREITIQDTRPSNRPSLPPQLLQAGNLAALEDGDDDVTTLARTGSHSTARPMPIAPAADHSSAAPAPVAPEKGSRSAVAFLVALVVLVVMAGAYYSGLLPGLSPR